MNSCCLLDLDSLGHAEEVVKRREPVCIEGKPVLFRELESA
jgi:hypothetical protein